MVKWANVGVLWKDANWQWSADSSSIIPPAPEQALGVAGITPWLIEPWNPYKSTERKRKLIKLICKIQGETFEQEKEMKQYAVAVDGVKLVVNNDVNLDVKKL